MVCMFLFEVRSLREIDAFTVLVFFLSIMDVTRTFEVGQSSEAGQSSIYCRQESVLDADLYVSSDSNSEENTFQCKPQEGTSKEIGVQCGDSCLREKPHDEYIESITGETSILSGTDSDTEQESPTPDWDDVFNGNADSFDEPRSITTGEINLSNDGPEYPVKNDILLLAQELCLSSDDSEPANSLQDQFGDVNKSDDDDDELSSPMLPDLPEVVALPPASVVHSPQRQGDSITGSREPSSLPDMPDIASLISSLDNISNSPVPVCSGTSVSRVQPSITSDLCPISDNQSTSTSSYMLSTSSYLHQGDAAKISIHIQPSVTPELDPMMASDSDESDSQTLHGPSPDQLLDLGQKNKKKHRNPPNQSSIEDSGADDDSDSDSSNVQSLDGFGGDHASSTISPPTSSSRKRSSNQKQPNASQITLTDKHPNAITPCPLKKQKKSLKMCHNASAGSLPAISGPLQLREKNRKKKKAQVSSSASSAFVPSVVSVPPTTPVLSMYPPTATLSMSPPTSTPVLPLSPTTPVPPFTSTTMTTLSPPQADVQSPVSHGLAPFPNTTDAPYGIAPFPPKPSPPSLNSSLTVDASSSLSDLALFPDFLDTIPSSPNLLDFVQADGQNYQATCCRCGQSCMQSEIILCEAQHQCCKRCVETMTVGILISQHKGWVRCPVSECNIRYSRDKLRSCLLTALFDGLLKKMEDDASSHMNAVCQDQYIPSHWEPMADNLPFTYIILDKDDEEYRECAMAFYSTMQHPRAQICNIYRIQNPYQWRLYSLKKEKMVSEHSDSTLLEMKLFHGTSVDAVSGISESGFDWRLSGSHGAMYGEGSYFAREASLSNLYSPSFRNIELRDMPIAISQQTRPSTGARRDELMQLVTGHMTRGVDIPHSDRANDTYASFMPRIEKHLMLRAHVLVGRYAMGTPCMRRPPLLNAADTVYGRRFDSCVDDVDKPTIHVIFEHGQAYAEHVIEYTNTYQCTW